MFTNYLMYLMLTVNVQIDDYVRKRERERESVCVYVNA